MLKECKKTISLLNFITKVVWTDIRDLSTIVGPTYDCGLYSWLVDGWALFKKYKMRLGMIMGPIYDLTFVRRFEGITIKCQTHNHASDRCCKVQLWFPLIVVRYTFQPLFCLGLYRWDETIVLSYYLTTIMVLLLISHCRIILYLNGHYFLTLISD